VDAKAITGRYVREKRLGAGGMAEVWAARDLELGRRVAIKFLSPGADRGRFQREALAAASLSHPNICQLFDFGEAEGRPFMVLEYLPGGTLEDRLAAGNPLPDDETARISRDIAAGLQHAHENGLVHRDLKPANILFDADGRAKIADFGIARMGGDGTITDTGMVLGTAAYLSPEQAAGEPATAASDVYGFGVILYRMLAGRLPFESEDVLELVRKHRDEAPRPVEELRPDTPVVLASLAMASLAKDPTGRPANGAAVAAELGDGEPTFLVAAAETRTRVLPFAARRGSAPRSARQRKLFGGIAGIALAAGGVAAALIATRDEGAARPVQVPTSQRSTGRGGGSTQATFTSPVSTQPSTTAASTTAPTRPASTRESTTEPQTTEPATDTLPTDTFPTDTFPTDTLPTDTVPTDTVPTDTIPTDTVATDTTPTDTLPTTDTVPTVGPETTPEPITTGAP
jgi:eukaryotic-like serine/threonine-protein kinase